MSEDMKWYAVRTRSNCEKKVSSLLTEKGVENYLPTFTEVHHWKDRKKIIDLPVFPGYLFTNMVDSRDTRLSVLRVDGVVNILGQAQRIEPVPANEIQAVRRLLDSTAHVCAQT